MKRASRGFGLIELLIALALGLIVVLGVVQIFIAAKNTYVSQNSAAAMQEDARFVLSKMIQEIRMVGMFGCLGTIVDSSSAGDFNTAQLIPISWDNASLKLTMVTADVGSGGGNADLDGDFRLSQQRGRLQRIAQPDHGADRVPDPAPDLQLQQ